MLVVMRRAREGLVIDLPDGTRVRVSVERVRKDQVTLGIAAPRSVLVLRDELVPPRVDENAAAC